MTTSFPPVEPSTVAFVATGVLTVGVLALTETFAALPAALAAYAAVWWVLRLAKDASDGPEETP